MYEPIIGTLGYVLSPERTHVLLVQRTARVHDHHLGKYNGLGGKLKADEDVLSCLTREIREEAGIACQEVRLRGTINWTGFGPSGENWLGFIFLVTRYVGTPFSENEEGELGWHALDSLHALPMWEGDRFFLPLVFDDDPRIFYGHMPYRNGRPLAWHYLRA
ncbi:MAG TPA: 7,8-dihydro-8-oxoguanine triphosphatase [Desulfobulbaceae bacterium]|nr:7,8-dihydro-8-oxoguanine triphosphatase [Desulfobulbaceae bacterium]